MKVDKQLLDKLIYNSQMNPDRSIEDVEGYYDLEYSLIQQMPEYNHTRWEDWNNDDTTNYDPIAQQMIDRANTLIKTLVVKGKKNSYNNVRRKPMFESMIKRLEELTNKKISLQEQYGGEEFTLPSDHKAGMQVPKGGSMCANCKFYGKEENTCGNQYWIKWNADNKTIPFPGDTYCCDWYNNK